MICESAEVSGPYHLGKRVLAPRESSGGASGWFKSPRICKVTEPTCAACTIRRLIGRVDSSALQAMATTSEISGRASDGIGSPPRLAWALNRIASATRVAGASVERGGGATASSPDTRMRFWQHGARGPGRLGRELSPPERET